MSSNRIGAQEPRVRIEPKRRYSDGPDACDLMESLGMVPDPWERDVLTAWLGRDEFDKFTATTCGLSVPRQNGKNFIIEMYELYHLTCIGSHILHTAHEVKTARKAFLRLASFFENDRDFPELAEMVVQIRKTNGQESITLNNGAHVEFSARSKGAARGFTVDTIIYDEAGGFLTDEQVEAIMSTASAAPLGNRQIIYTGTPPAPGMPGEVFDRVRRSAMEGLDKRSCWHEWSVEEIPRNKTFAEVVDLVFETNPGMGTRLDAEYTETEFNTMSEEGFARERLGWWPKGSAMAVIGEDEWGALATDDPPTEGKVAYGVKFSPDGSRVALAACRRPKEGVPHVECIEYQSMREGTSWLARWLVERKSKAAVIVIDGKSGVDPLVAQLREEGVSRRAIVVPRSTEVAASAARFLNAVREKSVTHYSQPLLNETAVMCKKRAIGSNGGWGWGGIGETDPSPMEAVSLAYWGVMTTKRDPSRKLRVK